MNTQNVHGNRRKRFIVLPDLQKRLIKQCSVWPFALLAATVVLLGFAWRRILAEFSETGAEVSSLGLLMIAFGFFFAGALQTYLTALTERLGALLRFFGLAA